MSHRIFRALLHRTQRWLENHLRALLFGLGESLRTPFASTMTLLVIAIAMTFPAGLYALLENVQQLAKQWHHDPTISVYLQPHVNQQQVDSMIKQLEQRDDVANVSYISPAQGLQEFQQQTHLDAVLKALPENPLPGILVITPKPSFQSADKIQSLLHSVTALPNTDSGQLDSLWIMRLFELITLGKRLTYGLMMLFGIGVALIVADTMRVATQSHSQEIMVLRLIGATSAFIRRPLLYRGALYGLCGGVMACLLVRILFWWLQAPSQRLAASYQDSWQLHSLTWGAGLAIVGSCTLLGLIGSWVSVERYLHTPEE